MQPAITRYYRKLCPKCESLTFTNPDGVYIPSDCETCVIQPRNVPAAVIARPHGCLFTRWVSEVEKEENLYQ